MTQSKLAELLEVTRAGVSSRYNSNSNATRWTTKLLLAFEEHEIVDKLNKIKKQEAYDNKE